MNKREKIGALVIILGFLVCVVALVLTARTPWGPPKAPEDSVFVQQHLKNIQKGN